MKKCPFCGYPANIAGKERQYYVECINFECPIKPISHINYPTKEEAQNAWDTRNNK